ncbi:hypothetical protein ACVME8_000356 [Bradyrhizobium diazoefficiens]
MLTTEVIINEGTIRRHSLHRIYYQLLATIPGEEAFKPMEEGGCPILKKR